MYPKSNGLSTPYQSHFAHYEEALHNQTLSRHTRRNYLTQARQFLLFAQKLGCDSSVLLSNQNVRDEVVERYRAELRQSTSASSGSLNTILATIKHFYRLSGQDIPEVQRERMQKTERIALPENEMARLLDVLKTTAIGNRDRAIVTLFYFGAIRLQECVDLDVADVAQTSNDGLTVLVRTSGEARVILLTDMAAQYVRIWLQERDATCFHATDALFLNRQGGRISPSGFDQIVRKVGLRAGLAVSARLLRNTRLMEQKNYPRFVREQ
jgi:site-specific recombinase XerC